MSDIEQILLNRVKLIGDGEWSLIGTPQELIDEINRLIVDELLNIPQNPNFIGEYIENRIKELESK